MRAICRYMGEPVTLVQVTRDYRYRDGKLGDFGVPGERVCTSIYRTSLILAFGPLALPAPHHDDAIYSVQSHLDFGVTRPLPKIYAYRHSERRSANFRLCSSRRTCVVYFYYLLKPLSYILWWSCFIPPHHAASPSSLSCRVERSVVDRLPSSPPV